MQRKRLKVQLPTKQKKCFGEQKQKPSSIIIKCVKLYLSIFSEQSFVCFYVKMHLNAFDSRLSRNLLGERTVFLGGLLRAATRTRLVEDYEKGIEENGEGREERWKV